MANDLYLIKLSVDMHSNGCRLFNAHYSVDLPVRWQKYIHPARIVQAHRGDMHARQRSYLEHDFNSRFPKVMARRVMMCHIRVIMYIRL